MTGEETEDKSSCHDGDHMAGDETGLSVSEWIGWRAPGGRIIAYGLLLRQGIVSRSES